VRACCDDRVVTAAVEVERLYRADDHMDLLVAYSRLFIGPGSVPAPPYGSVYLDGGVLMGPTTLAVAKSYREAGLVVDPLAAELPDHISLMLGFLHFVSLREAIAARNGEVGEAARWAEGRERFETEHLAPWAGKFTAKVQEAEPVPLYAAAARLLEAWVQRK